MSESEQHGSRDHSERSRGDGDRSGWGGQDDRGSSRSGGGRRNPGGGGAPRGGARGGYRGGSDGRPGNRGRDERSGWRRGDDRLRDDERRSGGSRDDRGGYRGSDGRRDDSGSPRRGSGRETYRDRTDRPGNGEDGRAERRRDDRGGFGRGDRPSTSRDGYRGRDDRRPGSGNREDGSARSYDARSGDAPRGGGRWRGGDGTDDVRSRRDERGGGRDRRSSGAAPRSGGRFDKDTRGTGDRGRFDRSTDRHGARQDRRDRDGHNGAGFTRRDDRARERTSDRRSNYGTYDRDERRGGHEDARPRFVAPDIDADVTGRELDRAMHHELKALEPSNAERVSQHLVMAARYLDDDPEFALEHASAAVRKAGRIGVVREAAGVAAYAAGDYALALKELRTHRRISGSQEHLPLMVDCQRALGRADKAMEEATSDAAAALDAEGKAELAMVISGIHADAGEQEAALAALQIPQLDKNRGFVYSPKLFRAYAEALRAVGRGKESTAWERQALVAEAALGMGQFSEPEIVDLGDDMDEDDARRTVQEAQRRHSAPRPDPAAREAPAAPESSGAEGSPEEQVPTGPAPTERSPEPVEPVAHGTVSGGDPEREAPPEPTATVSREEADGSSTAGETPTEGGAAPETDTGSVAGPGRDHD